jgi:hypothetical protein
MLPSSKVLGSYEEWAAIIGGVLEAAGIPGFLENREKYKARSDDQIADWRELVDAWFDEFGSLPVGIADLFGLAKKITKFSDDVLGRENDASQRIRFGRALGARTGQDINSLRIEQLARDNSGRNRYRLWPVWRRRSNWKQPEETTSPD